MNVDEELLRRFEAGLNPQNIEDSPIPAAILGFGEISSIFQIGDNKKLAFKRMPLFSEPSSAERYTRRFEEYCLLLVEAGLELPEHQTAVIQVPDRPVVCYIAQQRFPFERFGHRLIHHLPPKQILSLIEKVVFEISKIFIFNRSGRPAIEIALDGQISNWVETGDAAAPSMIYIDTSTPLYRKEGVEMLDPELFLKSAPAALRWIIRLFFLESVMNRYYDQRQVYIDLAANLYKEQRPDLVPITVEIINRHLFENLQPVTPGDVVSYYREDKLIWTLFLAFRKLDRWVKTKLVRKRYEFLLPGKIRR